MPGDFDLTTLVADDTDSRVVSRHLKSVDNDRDNTKTGRKAFAKEGEICDLHPSHTFSDGTEINATPEKPCAKFGHLPGNGRGIVQPRWTFYVKRLITTGIKPILFLVVIFGGYFLFKHGVSLGGNGDLLRPGGPVQESNCRMSNINGQPSDSGTAPVCVRPSDFPSSSTRSVEGVK